ncbi:MAG: hypothetical protein ACYS8Y_10645 [Planctomycetota bacterium]|jgi:hypothetical protein
MPNWKMFGPWWPLPPVKTEGIMMSGFVRYFVMLLILMAIVSCKGRQALKEDKPDFAAVPKQYRELYHELDDKLCQLSSSLHNQAKTRSNTSFGVELLVANSNRGEILLTDRVLRATVLTLDRLKDIGVKSVSLSIQYPILTRPFPRFAEYRRFYQQVVREIRSREFVLIVEIGTILKMNCLKWPS